VHTPTMAVCVCVCRSIKPWRSEIWQQPMRSLRQCRSSQTALRTQACRSRCVCVCICACVCMCVRACVHMLACLFVCGCCVACYNMYLVLMYNTYLVLMYIMLFVLMHGTSTHLYQELTSIIIYISHACIYISYATSASKGEWLRGFAA
jgi:hypothetical protein